MTEAEEIEFNKKLCEEYPFLKLRNVWTDEFDEDYTSTWLDAMPVGWKKAFGLQLCKELKAALGKHLNDYRIEQVKEKYGGLRWYDNFCTKESEKVISKYEDISFHTCCLCGKPATKISVGWICPYCDEHAPKESVNVQDFK